MAKFRKKPVVIDAVQFVGNFEEIEEFVGGDAQFDDRGLRIATLEGAHAGQRKRLDHQRRKGRVLSLQKRDFQSNL